MAISLPPSPVVQRIVVRGVNWLGDAVMTLPALFRLRERFPEAQITLVTPEKLAGLWPYVGAVNSICMIPPDESPWRTGRRLREHRAQLGIIFPNSARSALELWWARIPHRVGYARQWRSWLLTRPLRSRPGGNPTRKRSIGEIKNLIRRGANADAGAPDPIAETAHQTLDYLQIVASLGANPAPLAPRLAVNEEEVRRVAEKFGLPTTPAPGPALGLNPGAEYGPAKRWPVDRFIAAATSVRASKGCPCVIFGGPGDVQAAEHIAAHIGAAARSSGEKEVINLAGKTTLPELCAALASCRVLLTNDTGPMHLAAAVGTRVVVPYGSTSAKLTGPGLPGASGHELIESDVPCAPCFRRLCPIDFRCMTGITVERVTEAVLRAWD